MERDKVTKKAVELMKNGFICNNCLGRGFAELLTGMTNEERGNIIRHYIAFLKDSGQDIEIDESNFQDIEFRKEKVDVVEERECKICQNFFEKRVDKLAERIADKLEDYEFDTFLIGTILSPDLIAAEEESWMRAGIEYVEPIKSEINREVGKRVEGMIGKEVEFKVPDITVIIDMEKDIIKLQVRSVYVFGKYRKLVRGIPQAEWICMDCRGKGCVKCEGLGKMYETSVQEIIEKPFIKAAKAKGVKFHAAGREDVDARCLGKRPFVLELLRPKIRNFKPRSAQIKVNKSNKVTIHYVKFVDKEKIEEVKSSRYDKSYRAEVEFEKDLDKDKWGDLKDLKGTVIKQKTPSRVVHRRSDRVRKRGVEDISFRFVDDRKAVFEIKGEAGTYIKELISGDKGRTEPNIADILNNKVKNIKLDVIKIHDKEK